MSRILKVPEIDCLQCKQKGGCTTDPDKIETVDGIIVRPLICTRCGRGWKDFYGATDESSPVISLQRNSSSNNNRSGEREGNNILPESEEND